MALKGQAKLIKKLNKIATNLENYDYDPIGNLSVKEMKKEIFKGRSPLTESLFAPLSKSYKLQRQGKLSFFSNKQNETVYAKKSDYWLKGKKTHKEFKPSKSNLTVTGKMIESINYKKNKNGLDIFPSGQRNDSKLSNKQLAVIHSDGASITLVNGTNIKIPPRPFMGFSEKMVKKIMDMIFKDIKKLFR